MGVAGLEVVEETAVAVDPPHNVIRRVPHHRGLDLASATSTVDSVAVGRLLAVVIVVRRVEQR